MPDSAYGEGADGLSVGEIHIDNSNSPIGLKDRAYGYLSKRPEIKKLAKESGKKMKAFVSSYGTGIAIGTAVATAGIIGVELYRYRERKRGAIKNPHGKKR